MDTAKVPQQQHPYFIDNKQEIWGVERGLKNTKFWAGYLCTAGLNIRCGGPRRTGSGKKLWNGCSAKYLSQATSDRKFSGKTVIIQG